MKIKHSIIATILSAINLIAVNQVSALTYESDTNVDFTINPTISITVSGDLIIDNLTPGSSSDSNIIEVGVSTNASHGYYLSATVGSSNTDTNLTNSDNSNYTFTKLSSNVSSLSNFSDNEWGYSYSTDGGANWVSGSQGSTASGYNGLPLDNGDNGATGVALINTTSPVANGSVQFKIGAKASNTQASGTYTNTINFYAITNQTPISFNDAFAIEGKERLLGYYKMQDATPSICNAVTENQVGTLIDVRDNQTYKVAKLKDGKCWMVENLKIGKTLTESGDLITLIPANSNVNNNYTLNFSDIPTNGKFHAYTIDDVPNQNNSNEFICRNDWDSCYYNWYTATAGAGTTATTSGSVDTSICPAGWTLPTKPQFSSLYTQYNSAALMEVDNPTETKNNSTGKIPGFLLSGRHNTGGASGLGSLGLYWSRTASSAQGAYDLYLNTSSVSPADGGYKYNGFTVRCLAHD